MLHIFGVGEDLGEQFKTEGDGMKEYQVGAYVMHETAGVCQVTEISERALQGKGSEKMYYSLEPVFQRGSCVITPVEAATGKARIRDVKPREEIEGIMANLTDIPVIEETDDHLRAERIKEEVARFEPSALACVVKTAFLRKEFRIANGKKVMSADEKILQSVGKKLFQEMAFALEIKPDAAEQMFYDGLKEIHV